MRATNWLILYIVAAILLFISGKIMSRVSEYCGLALVICGMIVIGIAVIFCIMISAAEAW